MHEVDVIYQITEHKNEKRSVDAMHWFSFNFDFLLSILNEFARNSLEKNLEYDK